MELLTNALLTVSLNRFMNRFRNDLWTGSGDGPIDVHQHLWPPTLIEVLRHRSAPPRLRGWMLELADGSEYRVQPRDHDVDERAALVASDGLALALVSLSSALGIETLPGAEAEELLGAYHEGALALPRSFGVWASACLSEVDPDALERRLADGFVGLQLPATALLDASGYAHVASLLRVLEAHRRPLLIHPGPAPAGARGDPEWWQPLVPYVQQMHAAWFAFRVHGRTAHPELSVCFALLAGLAPLHGERLLTRGGVSTVVDPDVFLDVSSYGTRAIDATVRVLGIDVLVNGSDRPYAEPVVSDLGAALDAAIRQSNPLRLLAPEEVIDALDVTACAEP